MYNNDIVFLKFYWLCLRKLTWLNFPFTLKRGFNSPSLAMQCQQDKGYQIKTIFMLHPVLLYTFHWSEEQRGVGRICSPGFWRVEFIAIILFSRSIFLMHIMLNRGIRWINLRQRFMKLLFILNSSFQQPYNIT